MKRTTLALGVLGVLLVTVVWFLLLINPMRSEISDVDDEIDAARIQAQGLRGEIAALKDIRDSELTYQRAIAEVLDSIPATPELASFIEDVNLLAIETGVDVAALNPAPPATLAEGQAFQPLAIDISATGQFFEVLGFLYGLQDLERLVKINTVSLVRTTAEGTAEMSLSLQGSIFTLATNLPTPTVEPVEPPAEEAPAAEEESTETDESADATDDGESS